MASSLAVCRLHTRGRSALLEALRRVEARLLSHSGAGAAAAAAAAADAADAASPCDTPRGARSEEKPGYKSFHTVLSERQEQAERSVLISCPSKTKQRSIQQFLSQHGDIKELFSYESYGMYTVVEFSNQESVASLLEAASIPKCSHESMVPYKSRLMSLTNLGPEEAQCQRQTSIPINDLIKTLSREETMDRQISTLTEVFQLTEENTRLRFLVCSLLKDIAAAYFPECTIRPFGSSVNGFGKLGCDLDMFLDLDGISGRNVEMPKSGLLLEYQMKQANSERSVTQSILSVIGECVDQFGPGCVGVQKILSARCPLVRFAHQPSGFQCDLTANNRVAMKSSELLFLYAQVDQRVRQLVFAVRCWARAQGVTSSIPGAWITNFSLTIMVLFFLQGRSPPIIPTLDHLKDLAGPLDKSVIKGNDCTFVSDLSKIQLHSNKQTAEQLLREFFDFYATFNFSKKSINIRKGKEMNKPETAPLHIHNPFETSLNVSKNVNGTQLERFVALCKESSWLLQQSEHNSPRGSTGHIPWGLATLLLPSQVPGVNGRKKRRKEPASERIKSLLESLKSERQSKS